LIYFKTILSLGVLRNHMASIAIAAVHRHLATVFRKKRLDTIETRARYITTLLASTTDHPIIWREYVEGTIQNHPEVGGYKTVWCFLYCTIFILNILIDQARCVPVRAYPRNAPKLLFSIRHHGRPPTRRSRGRKPTNRYTRPCSHRSTSCSYAGDITTLTHPIRSSVRARCILLVTLLRLPNSSMPVTGVRQPPSLWTTLFTISTTNIGIRSSLHLPPILHKPQRMKLHAMVPWTSLKSECRFPLLTPLLRLATISYPGNL
jgi:hypothetical protein